MPTACLRQAKRGRQGRQVDSLVPKAQAYNK
jgi:hypothetical protein